MGWNLWWDRECREKKKAVQRVRRRYRRKREKREWDSYLCCRKEYRELCEKKELEYKIREEKEIEKIRTESQAWNFINKGRRKRKGVSKDIKMEDWVKHFLEVLEESETKKEEERKRQRKDGRDEEGIKEEDIREEIRRLKRGKAAGLDGIRNEA